MKRMPVDHINILDRRFSITYPLHDATLYASVQKVGVIQPLLLLQGSARVLISGFRRLAVARQLGLREIPCISVDISDQQALLFAIHDNLQRGLNLVEKAHAFERMLSLGLSSSEIADVFALLGLHPHDKIRNILLALASSGDAVKDFIVRRALPMKIVDYLMRFDGNERSSIVHLLLSAQGTESTVRQILEGLLLLKIREGRVPFERITAATGEELVSQINKMTHPALTALRSDLHAMRQRSALPPNMDIRVDPFFEKEYIDIGIRAKTTGDIEGAIEKLHRLVQDGTIGSILDLTKGHIRSGKG